MSSWTQADVDLFIGKRQAAKREVLPQTAAILTPKPRKSKANPEYKIQAAFVRAMTIKYPHLLVFSDTAAHIRKTMFQQLRANALQSQMAKDWPDVFVAQPSGDYAGLFLEFKSESPYLKDGRTLSKNKHIQAQKQTMDRLTMSGYHCQFVWTVEQAMGIVEKYFEA